MSAERAGFDGVEVLSFDCYGTLIDWETGLLTALEPIIGGQRPDLDADAILAAYAAAEAHVEHDDRAGTYPQVLASALRQLADTLGLTVTEGEVAAFAASVPAWPAFPDSADALALLARRYRLIILSNIDNASFAASSRHLGVEFDAVLTAEDLGCYKPDERAFHALLAEVARGGTPPGRHVHVAQSLYHDHVPALACGLPTVWINRRHGRTGWGATPPPRTPVTPTWEFPSLAEFAAAQDEGRP